MTKINHADNGAPAPILPQYRYRKGWFNKCVLQELVSIEPWQVSDDPPPWATTRYEWRDVKYSEVTIEVICDETDSFGVPIADYNGCAEICGETDSFGVPLCYKVRK